MRGLALLTAASWLLFSFHLTVAHPLVDCWHNLSPGHDLSGTTHAHCEGSDDHPGCSCTHEELPDTHTAHCHSYHSNAAKIQPKIKLITPPVFTLLDSSTVDQPVQQVGPSDLHAGFQRVPIRPLFLTQSSLLL
jgi:hypothetical protein